MNEEQVEIIKKILNRMIARRQKEEGGTRFLTLSYAVSTKTGTCYVGYNDRQFKFGDEKDLRWGSSTGKASSVAVYGFNNLCAEASALSVALSWGESIQDLVFLSMNKDRNPFNPCELCCQWILENPKGVLYCEKDTWKISNAESFSSGDWKKLERAAADFDANDVEDYKGVMSF